MTRSDKESTSTQASNGIPVGAQLVPSQSVRATDPHAPRPYELTNTYDPGAYGNLLFGGSGSEQAPAWSDTAKGRFIIRTVSRGLVGALAFTWGGHMAGEHLGSYKPGEAINAKKWLQYPARLIDNTFGKLIQKAVFTFHQGTENERALAALESVNFRTKLAPLAASLEQDNVYRMTDHFGKEHTMFGRSIGSEATNMTFDFFMASIGDATTRNVIQAIDPNIKHSWMLDKDGNPTTRAKGHFDTGKAIKELGSTSWRILTKNAGEDWAAALPYIYQMRWQRQAISKVWPGFKLSSDRALNGGAALVNAAGEIGNGFQKAGALDLHCRFVGYNFYTLMFREGYDSIANTLKDWKDDHFTIHAPTIGNPLTAAIEGAAWTARYTAKSFIKANLYMQPAVLPFWLIRVPQSKWRGIYTNEELIENGLKENAVFGTSNGANFPRAMGVHGANYFGEINEAHWGNGNTIRKQGPTDNKNNIFAIKHPYEWGTKRNIFDSTLNLFGSACYHTGTAVTHLVDRIVPIEKDAFAHHLFGTDKPIAEQLWKREQFVRKTVDASLAYTPYMWAKAETGQRVDDRKSVKELGYMDRAIYELLDNLGTFNWKGIQNSAKEVFDLATHYEKPIKMREGGEATPEHPVSTIQGNTIEHTPQTARSTFASDPAANTPTPTPTDPRAEKRWAESITGRQLGASFQPPQALLH